ncbi:MAG: hypothetical protein CSA10_00930 [Cardiobacteriales bacterium]|nr:MAG: hypothetical protein CSA10_00930 [Cardiobacteriales bacterium]
MVITKFEQNLWDIGIKLLMHYCLFMGRFFIDSWEKPLNDNDLKCLSINIEDGFLPACLLIVKNVCFNPIKSVSSNFSATGAGVMLSLICFIVGAFILACKTGAGGVF